MSPVEENRSELAVSPKQQTKLTQFLSKKPNIKALAEAALSPTSNARSNIHKKRAGDILTPPEKRKNQQIIDAGQKECGPRLCKICGLCYDPDDEMDNILHQRNCLKPGDKSAHFILKHKMNLMQHVSRNISFVHCATPQKSTKEMMRVRNILRVIEEDFDSVEMKHLSTPTDVVLFYLDTSGAKDVVVGCLAAETVDAHSTWSSSDIPETLANPVRTVCGIYLLWVAADHRRTGIATNLVNCLRKQYNRICRQYGQPLRLNEMAFSVTTSAGDAFVEQLNGGAPWRKYVTSKTLSASRC